MSVWRHHEVSQVFDVLYRIRSKKKLVAIVAPAILGQFKAEKDQVYGALREMGFADVIEVAQGAMETVEREGHELLERLEEGQPFMTTSCCPSYKEMVKKHAPDMAKYVSDTRSPMYYTARLAKQQHPDADVVFIVRALPSARKPRATKLWTSFSHSRKSLP